MVHGDGELSGRCLRQAPARIAVGLGGQLDLLLARGTHPPGEPLRRQARPARRRVARGWAGRGPRPPAGRIPRRRARRRPGRAGGPSRVARRWWASKAAATRRSSGSAGVSSTRPTTDSVSSIGHPAPAQTATSPASSSSVSMSSSAEAVMRRCAGEIVRAQPGDVGLLGLDGDRGPVGGRAGELGGGHRQQVCVAVVHDPVLAARAAAARASGPSRRCRRRGRGSPSGRLPGARRARCSTRSRARAAASAGSRRASHSRLTRISGGAHRDAPARTPARTDAVVDHPDSDSRRSRAARRNRALSSASPSQARSAAASAAGSSGGTSSPGRVPSAP